MYSNEETKLIGLVIEKILINSEKTVLQLVTNQGSKYLYAEGDCCSRSWFENITGVNNLVDQRILSLEDTYLKEIEPEDSKCDGYIKFYSFVLKTEKGKFEIEYRNSSNGYYGGSIEFGDDGETPYNCDEPENMKLLTEDF